jgi:hypothetical protein
VGNPFAAAAAALAPRGALPKPVPAPPRRGAFAALAAFAAAAEALTAVTVTEHTPSMDHAMALLDLARHWPHFIRGERLTPRRTVTELPGGGRVYEPARGDWQVEVHARRPLSTGERRDWHTKARALVREREREAARHRRDEAEVEARRAREAWEELRRAVAVVTAARAAAPPGSTAGYIYVHKKDNESDRADLVPIAARVGALFARKTGAHFTFVHEPTGMSVAAPDREVVKTKRRAVELLERAAQPAVLAALDAALARDATRETYQQFYAAWAADPAPAATARPARKPERGKVTEVSGRIEGEVLVLEVSGAHNRELEEWTVRAKAGLLKEAFGLDVKLVDGAAASAARPSKRASTPPAPPVSTVRSGE